MKIPGLDRKESAVLSDLAKLTPKKAVKIASKSAENYKAVFGYLSAKRYEYKTAILREFYTECLEAVIISKF